MNLLLAAGVVIQLLLATACLLMLQVPASARASAALLPVLLASFIPYLIAVWLAPRMEWRRIRWLVVIVAVLARITLLPAPLILSNDAYRYHWEGTVQAAGYNPYRFSPGAPELANLRDINWGKISHRETPSAYPPLLLLIFRLGRALSSNPAIFKVIFTLFDLRTFWVLLNLLRARGQNESLALVWAWNPLVIVEFAGMGHEMSLAICFLVTGLWLMENRTRAKDIFAGLAFAAAVLSQFFATPLVLAAVASQRVKSCRFWLPFVVMILGFFALFASAGRELPVGLLHFGARWRFNASLFDIFASVLDGQLPRHLFADVWLMYPRTKMLVAGILLVVIGWGWVKKIEATRACFAATAAVLLFSSTVHPWYVTWIVALLCVRESPAWLAFSALVMISYVSKMVELQTGQWVEPAVVRWLEYAPFFVLLIAELWRMRFDSTRHTQ